MFELPADEFLADDAARGLTLHAEASPSNAFIELLERTQFGGTGLTYRQLDIAERLARLPASAFIELRQNGRLAGTYVLSTRPLVVEGNRCAGIYRSLLTLDDEFRGQGHARFIVQQSLAWIEKQAKQEQERVLAWGCIENENTRSLRLLSAQGAQQIGTLQSLTVFRQWPRRRMTIESITPPHGDTMAAALSQCYTDCALQYASPVHSAFFAVTDDSGIVAGARASVTRVQMTSTGGMWDLLNDKLLRHVPAARRRYDPTNFTYLRLSDVIVREGQEHVWPDFLTTLLAEHDVYMAMFVLDPRANTCRLLRDAGVFGRLTRSTRQQIAVMANGWNLDAGILTGVANKPVAIGPLDS